MVAKSFLHWRETVNCWLFALSEADDVAVGRGDYPSPCPDGAQHAAPLRRRAAQDDNRSEWIGGQTRTKKPVRATITPTMPMRMPENQKNFLLVNKVSEQMMRANSRTPSPASKWS